MQAATAFKNLDIEVIAVSSAKKYHYLNNHPYVARVCMGI